MTWLICIGLLLGTWTTWSFTSLYVNYRAARKIGLPIIVSPVSVMNLPWILSYRLLPFDLPKLLSRLPFGLGKWALYTYTGWQYDDAGAIHAELGPAFVLCTPSVNEVAVADPAAAHVIMSRRKEFPKPAKIYKLFDVFGRNLETVEGSVWQRHRRLTAPSLNERVSETVWSESLRQASQMLQVWVDCGDGGTRNVASDAATLALHVWTKAGFGVQHPFRDFQQRLEPQHKMSYRDAMQVVLRKFIFLIALPTGLLASPIMPRALRQVGNAAKEFRLYMREMVEREKVSHAKSETEGSNLLSALVRASEDAAKSKETGTVNKGLEDDELYGNIFIFSMAGHETTANAIANALVYLAAYPQWQGWVAEEIRNVVHDSAPKNWRYEDTFSRLHRCLAVMVSRIYLNDKYSANRHSSRHSDSTAPYHLFQNIPEIPHKRSTSAGMITRFLQKRSSWSTWKQYK